MTSDWTDWVSEADISIKSTAWTPAWADRVIEIVSLTSAEHTTATKVSTTLYLITDA